MAINLKGRHFLKLEDFTPQELSYLLDLSQQLKAQNAGAAQVAGGEKHRPAV